MSFVDRLTHLIKQAHMMPWRYDEDEGDYEVGVPPRFSIIRKVGMAKRASPRAKPTELTETVLTADGDRSRAEGTVLLVLLLAEASDDLCAVIRAAEALVNPKGSEPMDLTEQARNQARREQTLRDALAKLNGGK